MDKNKYVKKNVAVELETLARFLDPHITHREKESFQGYLRSATNITKNVYSDTDNTYKSLSNMDIHLQCIKSCCQIPKATIQEQVFY